MASEMVRCEEHKNPDGSFKEVFIQLVVDTDEGTVNHGHWLTPDELAQHAADKVAFKPVLMAKHEARALRTHAAAKAERDKDLLLAQAQQAKAEAEATVAEHQRATVEAQLAMAQISATTTVPAGGMKLGG